MESGIFQNFHPGFDRLTRALSPVVLIRTTEIKRVAGYLRFYCESFKFDLAVFNPSRGVVFLNGKPAQSAGRESWSEVREPLQALEAANNYRDSRVPTIFLFPYLDLFFSPSNPAPDPYLISHLRALANRPPSRVTVVLAGKWRLIPEEISDLPILDFPLPGPEEVSRYLENTGKENSREIDPTLAGELTGLPLSVIEGVLAEACVLGGKREWRGFFREKKLKYMEEKFRGALEFHEPGRSLDDIGGYRALKEHVRKRRVLLEKKTALDCLKGILLIGFPGTGKSSIAEAVAGSLRLPLVRLNISLLFSSYVGVSESRMDEVLKTLEAFSGRGMVLWLDEFEKMFANDREGRTDGGVGSRMSAIFLHWVSERKPPGLYLVATANSLGIEPALWRRGRFEEIFWLDPPALSERAEILTIILRRLKLDPVGIDIMEISRRTELFVGAELESLAEAALVEAESRGVSPTTLTFLEVLKNTGPQLRLFEDSFRQARDSVLRFAALANGPEEKPAPRGKLVAFEPGKKAKE